MKPVELDVPPATRRPAEQIESGCESMAPSTQPLPGRRGTLFIGYVEANLGLGESLRGLIAAAITQKVSVAIYPFHVGVETRLSEPFLPEYYDTIHGYDVNVIEVAVDQMPHILQNVDERILNNSYNILRTYWELSTAPAEWGTLLTAIDEIWAPNSFVKQSLSSVFSGKITILPPSVNIDQYLSFGDRSTMELSEDRYLFLFTFDYNSFPSRKNPLGVLRAFQQAFPKGSEGVGLIIKSTGTPSPEIERAILEATEADSRIAAIDKTLPRAELLALISACDCYVSLHRSEGFGLGMVEAMGFGKPVIATGYSGSEDFLSADTGFPVDYVMRPLEPGEYVYSEGAEWAEPSIEHAASLMRFVHENPEEAMATGQRGKKYVSERYAPEVVGTKIETRLREIRLSLSRG